MSAAALTPERRTRLRRRVKFIVGITITWNLIEAIIAISVGAIASSAALIGFGLDSIIEVASAVAIAWQFTRKEPERWEKVTVRVIGIAFFALAAYVTVDALLALTGLREPDHSPIGIGIAVVSLIVMPVLAWVELRTGRELRSKSVQADARQLLLCTYLSGTVLIGLLLNSLFGWAWADSIAALVVAVLAIREGIEAWRGDIESPLEVLGDLGRDDHEEGSLMTHIGSLNDPPVACTLTTAAGKARVEKWREFDHDFALGAERTDSRLTVHYAKVDRSIRRLHELVVAESTCCAFVDWSIDDTHADLRLIVTGTPRQLAALNVG